MKESFYPEFSARFGALLPELRRRKVAVIGHARPDGDCIGSQVALARILTAAGVDAVCVNGDPVPRRLRFLARQTLVLPAEEILPVAADHTAIYVDCADAARCGVRLSKAFPRPLAVFDHHLSNRGFAEHDFIDAGSAATAEILAGVALDLELAIDAETAQALYTGILTDTGQFRYHSTSRRTFMLAAELLSRGARPAEAGYELYERESIGKLRLLESFLRSLKFEADGRVCIGLLSQGVFAATGSDAEDTEGLVDYARLIDGVEVGVLIEERESGGVKASLRAKNPACRVDRIAGRFNGGGHACAAGLTTALPTSEFYPALVAEITAQLTAISTSANDAS
ncbi:MAG: bifunctional oligoribonuclease/PAP phosphatase NrnA [Opitutaceae bacterium]|nr:bifunctional oligoribonuclease/PAP phosphatase NrnA [Opitutaceae bacterium]